MKGKVTEKPILALLDFNKVLQVECDASGTTIGVVLTHQGRLVAILVRN